MTPAQFLILMFSMTVLAGAWQWLNRRRQVDKLQALADELQMHFSADDRFRISSRIAPRLPVAGAAAVRVFDLLYGVEEANYRYIFRTEYTLGVLRSKVSVQGVATFSEPRDRSARMSEIQLEWAPRELGLIEQYRALHKKTQPPLARTAETSHEDAHAI